MTDMRLENVISCFDNDHNKATIKRQTTITTTEATTATTTNYNHYKNVSFFAESLVFLIDVALV